jgi:hypothetical protein
MEAPAVNVNGQLLPLDGVAPHLTALDWLRERGSHRVQGGLRGG